jgi:hypothetical protein
MNKLEGDKLSAYGWFAKDSPKRIKWHLFGVSEDQPVNYLILIILYIETVSLFPY